MSNVLEINIAAKQIHTAPPTGGIAIQTGLIYVLANGTRVICGVPEIVHGYLRYRCPKNSHPKSLGDWYTPDGKWYTQQDNDNWPLHIVRQWISHVHDEWLKGAEIQYKLKQGDIWSHKSVTTASTANQLFGPNESISGNWMLSIFGPPSIYEVRVKPSSL